MEAYRDRDWESLRRSLQEGGSEVAPMTPDRYVELEARIMELDDLIDDITIIFDSIPVKEMQLGYGWIPSAELLILMNLAKDRLHSYKEHR